MVPLNKKLIHSDTKLEIFDSINSTNDYLKPFVKEGLPRICLSEHQTAGRGREQRVWHSPAGVNIYFSSLTYFDKPLSALSGLSLVVGLAVAKTLQHIANQSFLVKWPNDVYYADKKISGNLIELYRHHDQTAAIIGIGINVNMQSDDNTIAKPWTSLQKILHNELDRNGIVTQLILQLFDHLKRFSEKGLPAFLEEWPQFDFLKGKTIDFLAPTGLVHGIAQGIDVEGRLLIQLPDGKTQSFSSGEIKALA